MDKNHKKSRSKSTRGRGRKKSKDTNSVEITKPESKATSVVSQHSPHTIITTSNEHDEQLANYLISSHVSDYSDVDKTPTHGKRPLSTSPVPPNKRYRLLNADGEVEGHAVPFSGYLNSSGDERNKTNNSSIPVIVKSEDRLTPDNKINIRSSPDPHNRLSPLIAFPPHLERQSPLFHHKTDIKSSPSRLSPYFDHRHSPDLFRTEIQSINKDKALDLSPAKAPSPVNRPSISPFKAHLLQAVPESERYSPSKYYAANSHDSNGIKTLSPKPESGRYSPRSYTANSHDSNDMKSVSPRPDSDRYTPNRFIGHSYDSTDIVQHSSPRPERNHIKTISPTPRVSLSPSSTNGTLYDQKTLVRMLKDGSNLVPVTVVTSGSSSIHNHISQTDRLSMTARTNKSDNISPIPARTIKSENISYDKPISLLREHLTGHFDKALLSNHNVSDGFTNNISQSFKGAINTQNKRITNAYQASATVNEIAQNLLKSKEEAARLNMTLESLNEIKQSVQSQAINSTYAVQNNHLNLAIYPQTTVISQIPQYTVQPQLLPGLIPYIGYNVALPLNLDSLNKPQIPERCKPEPPANPFFQNLRLLEEAANRTQTERNGLTESKPSTKRKKKHDSSTTHSRSSFAATKPVKSQTKTEVEYVSMCCPYNRRKEVLSKFPNVNSSFRSKAQGMALHRIRYGCTTSAAKSLDLLRRNLQKSLNDSINDVINSFVDKFFKPAIENIKFNSGMNAVGEEHIQVISRQILEEAKKMYENDGRRSVSPLPDTSDTVSETGSYTTSKRLHNGLNRVKVNNRPDSDSELSIPFKKKKGRPALHTASGRSTPSKNLKLDNVRRDGPKWDPDRLTTDTEFVMGARANKALGLGATRGRLYIKHPEIFKYCGDQEDKQWLYDNQYMPAAGGKAYLLVVGDIQDLAESDEYRNGSLLMMDAITPFSVPQFMINKMKIQMESLRTDDGKKTDLERPPSALESEAETIIPGVPFTNFIDDDDGSKITKDIHLSPANTEEMDLLSTTDQDDTTDMSPFTMTGGFDEVSSPVTADFDTLADDHTLTAPFDLSK